MTFIEQFIEHENKDMLQNKHRNTGNLRRFKSVSQLMTYNEFIAEYGHSYK